MESFTPRHAARLFSSLTVFLCALAMSASTQAAPSDTPKPAAQDNARTYDDSVPAPTQTEVRYGNHPRHVMDFWQAESDEPTPLVFVIHGGGWNAGSKEMVHRFADVADLLEAGISVVAINYRYIAHGIEAELEPPVQAPLHDAARALQFVRSMADEWNIDKTRIAAAGGSAGACTSLWLAYHDDLADPESDDPIARESTRLFCAAVFGAQTTLDPAQMKAWTPNSTYGGHAFGFPNFQTFLAGRERILPWIAEYSPYALASEDDPPVFLRYFAPPSVGDRQRDPTHTANFGAMLQERCETLGIACVVTYPKAPDMEHALPTAYLIDALTEDD